LLDKLRRTHLSLKDIHDLGGARMVIDGGRLDQERAVERIMRAFGDCPKPPLKIDRREDPSHGYRAVHVIVYAESTPMEIQVRTKLQDTWAQISEKLGDIWGRGLRYGEGPDQPDAAVMLGTLTTRGKVVEQLLLLSEMIDGVESNDVELSQLREDLLELPQPARTERAVRLTAMEERATTLKDQLQSVLDRLLQDIRQLGGAK
jgi:hypothetical protein